MLSNPPSTSPVSLLIVLPNKTFWIVLEFTTNPAAAPNDAPNIGPIKPPVNKLAPAPIIAPAPAAPRLTPNSLNNALVTAFIFSDIALLSLNLPEALFLKSVYLSIAPFLAAVKNLNKYPKTLLSIELSGSCPTVFSPGAKLPKNLLLALASSLACCLLLDLPL